MKKFLLALVVAVLALTVAVQAADVTPAVVSPTANLFWDNVKIIAVNMNINLSGTTAYDWNHGVWGGGTTTTVAEFWNWIDLMTGPCVFNDRPSTIMPIYSVNADLLKIPTKHTKVTAPELISLKLGVFYAPDFNNHANDRCGGSIDIITMEW